MKSETNADRGLNYRNHCIDGDTSWKKRIQKYPEVTGRGITALISAVLIHAIIYTVRKVIAVSVITLMRSRAF